MPQITQLDNDPTPNNNDLLVTVDMAAGTTKNISREQFFTGAPLPANTVNGQAIADSSVTSNKLNVTTYVDANGWTVYDLGGTKKYARSWHISSPGTIGANLAIQVVASFSLPVGKSPSSLFLSVDGGSSAASTALYYTLGYNGTSTSTSDTYNVFARNLTNASISPGTITVVVNASDR